MSRKEAKGRASGQEVRRQLEQAGVSVRARSVKLLSEEAPYAYKDVDEGRRRVCSGQPCRKGRPAPPPRRRERVIWTKGESCSTWAFHPRLEALITADAVLSVSGDFSGCSVRYPTVFSMEYRFVETIGNCRHETTPRLCTRRIAPV